MRVRLGGGRYALVIGTVLLVPLVVALAIGLWGAHWHATSDQALEVLRIHDVGTSHTPMLGAPSRFGWSHPGPIQFWMMAPFYRVFGQTGILAGMAVLNVISLAISLWLAFRIGGRTLTALVALGSAVLVHALTVPLLLDPWNPWAAVLPFLVTALAAFGVALGDVVALPILVAAGTFTVQVHVGYSPIVAVLAATAIASRVAATFVRHRRHRRGPLRRRSWWLVWLSAGLLVVLWLPPLIQQVIGHPGNLTELIRYFRDPGEAAVGWAAAVGIAGRQLAPIGPWISGHETGADGLLATAAVAPAVALLLIVAVLGGAAWRVGARRPAAMTALVLVLDLAGVVATSRVTGASFEYLVRWWWPLAMLTAIAGVWSVASIVGPHLRRVRVPVRALGAVAVLAVALIAAVGGSPVRVPEARASETVGGLVTQVRQHLDKTTSYVIVSVDSIGFGAVAVGVTTQLQLRGYRAFGPAFLAQAYGPWRTRRPDQVSATVFVVNAENELTGWNPPQGAERIARLDPIDQPRARGLAYDVYLARS